MKRLCSSLLLALAVGLIPRAVGAGLCFNCKEWLSTDPDLFPDQAQCCLSDDPFACSLIPGGFLLYSYAGSCRINLTPTGYQCANLASNTCSPGPRRECDDTGSAEEGLPGCSPILIDLDTNGFHLTGPDDPVRFDFDGDGAQAVSAWTDGGSRDAFLAYDRNHNGRVDDGSELFGNVTRLLGGSQAESGYHALRELDFATQGGNEDGSLTPDDVLFHQLSVWIDEDHDGLSEPGELLTLDQAGVLALSYSYHESRRRDRHGNEFRYQAAATLRNSHGASHASTTYDVFLAAAPGE